eukprot:CAMPEP_0196770904 /NCGR_PEP_ID=MMETSP1104-20130614/1401_1 /TAXON_ID=33652 /ORGANISM="Cafeteria sp., Strain Caron Lab Isolate" /LENGTH=797 /DNA_ID=CAMNT_0042141019 /DNA_START=23 /DNA_END=2413 /DNA_ORIENTATION=-
MRWPCGTLLLLVVALTEHRLVYGAPPSIVAAEYETRQVGSIEYGEHGEVFHDQYHAALVTVSFDQPLFVNGSVPFSELSPDTNSTRHLLYGAARLECGHVLVEMHPSPVPMRLATDRHGYGEPLPTFLLPLNEPYDHPVAKLFSVFKRTSRESSTLGENRLVALLVLDYEERGTPQSCVDPSLLPSCRIRFLPEQEQSWWPVVKVTNVAGEPVVTSAPLVRVDAELLEEHAHQLAELTDRIQREGELRSKQQEADVGAGAAEGGAADNSHVAVSVLLEQARGKHFADSNNIVDTTRLYSLLEVMHRVGTLERVEANQYFELIEDPLLNLLVPMAVDVATAATRKPIIIALCKLLSAILPKILAQPISAEIKMLQTDSGVGVADFAKEYLAGKGLLQDEATAGDGSRWQEELLARLPDDTQHRVRDAVEEALRRDIPNAASKVAAQAVSESRRRSAGRRLLSTERFRSAGTLTPTLEAAGDVHASSRPPRPPPGAHSGGSRGEEEPDSMDRATLGSFQEIGVLEGPEQTAGCSAQPTESACKSYSAKITSSQDRCTWCMLDTMSGSGNGICTVCRNTADVIGKGYKCLHEEEQCAAPEGDGEQPKGSPEPDEWRDAPEGTQLEELLADMITDSTVDQVASDVHNNLVENLKLNINATAVRATGRVLVQEISTRLITELTIVTSATISKLVTRIASKELTKALTPSITHAVTPAVAHALTRRPAVDYYCRFCAKQKLYCEYCHAAAVEDYYLDYYADYYAEYYSRYYGYWYSSAYADLFASEQLFRAAHTKDPAKGEAV